METIKAFGGKTVTRAPKGGFDHPVNGRFYKGGRFCPMYAVAGGSEEAKPEGVIEFQQNNKGTWVRYKFVVELAEKIEPDDADEWTVAEYYVSVIDGKLCRGTRERGFWKTKGLALANLEYTFGQYAIGKQIERIN